MSTADGPNGTPEQPGTVLDDVPLSPPPECIKVTPDGGVLKNVVAEGSGDLPVRHGRCLGKPECSNQLSDNSLSLLGIGCGLLGAQLLRTTHTPPTLQTSAPYCLCVRVFAHTQCTMSGAACRVARCL